MRGGRVALVAWAIVLLQVLTGCGAENVPSGTPTGTPPPSGPVANAGPDQANIAPGTVVTLDGRGSSDSSGRPLTYDWTFTSKPSRSTAVLTNATTVSPSLIVDQAGDYIVQLIVSDGIVNSAPDTVTITTNNVRPVANAGLDQTAAAGTLVTLNGGGSTDVNGDPLTYSWSFTSMPTGSAAVLANPTSLSPTFVVDRAGNYIAQLIVNDGAVDSLPDSVTVSTGNVKPVANAGPDQGNIAPGALVTLNGSGSSDADGNPLTYSWAFTSKPTGSVAVLANPTSVSPTFTVDRDGDYIAQLIVNDGTVNSDPDTVTITSNNVAPIANAGPDQTVERGTLVSLNGSGSSDANGDPLTYSWALTSKPDHSTAVLANPTSVSPTFTADRGGQYIVQLIVNDGAVNSLPDTGTIRAR